MSVFHSTGIFDVQGSFYQAVCSCGWLSTTSFLEEVDLLRALHAHQMTVFDQVEAERVLSEGVIILMQESREASGE